MRITTTILLLVSLLLLCCACGSEKPEKETPDALIRYEGGAAYYTQKGADLSMELHFAQPVKVNSEIALLKGDTKLLSFTTSAAISQLTISTMDLEKNVPYSVTVNGVPQRHGVDRDHTAPNLGDIPDPVPVIPTIPVEPMTEATEATQGQEQPTAPSVDAGSSLDSLLPNLDVDIPTGSIGSIDPNVSPSSPGVLPNEPFTPGKGQEDSPTLPGLNPQIPQDATQFALMEDTTQFRFVRDAL